MSNRITKKDIDYRLETINGNVSDENQLVIRAMNGGLFVYKQYTMSLLFSGSTKEVYIFLGGIQSARKLYQVKQ